MTELFIKETFSKDFKEILGFVHADLAYVRLRPDLFTATNYIKEIISQEVYDEIKQETPETEVYQALLYAIAIEAYRLHAPTSDLSHTNQGRKMISDEKYKTAFEWMTERDDEQLQIRSDRAVSTLLTILETKDYFTDSEFYKEYSKLHVNTIEKFSKVYPIDSRLLFLRLKPFLKECELSQIVPRINKPIKDIDDQTILSIISEACVFYALSKGFTRLRATLLPTGLSVSETNYGTSRKPAGGLQAEQLSQLYMQDAEKCFLEIELKMNTGSDDLKDIGFEFNEDSPFVSS